MLGLGISKGGSDTDISKESDSGQPETRLVSYLQPFCGTGIGSGQLGEDWARGGDRVLQNLRCSTHPEEKW